MMSSTMKYLIQHGVTLIFVWIMQHGKHFEHLPRDGVRGAHLHQNYKPCTFEAIPLQI